MVKPGLLSPRLVFCLWVMIIFNPAQAYASHDAPEAGREDKSFDTFTLYWENDAFAGTDRDYSNGLKLTWSTPYELDEDSRHLPDWSYPLINRLPFVKDPGLHRAVSLSVGQMIFTPAETWRHDLVIDDRPYAGYLYTAGGFHNRTRNQKNSWELQIGVVGPLAFGEESQDIVHDLLGSKKSQGWEHQLGNEIALEIIYESQARVDLTLPRQGYKYDLIPHWGVRIGNVQTYANIGAEIRYGWNLPLDFGSCPIRAGCATNSAFRRASSVDFAGTLTAWHIFAATEARLVGHDIFLDGNTFRDSHSVDREVLVGDLMAGLVLDFGKIKTVYSYLLRTKQFSSQPSNHRFGSLTVSLTY